MASFSLLQLSREDTASGSVKSLLASTLDDGDIKLINSTNPATTSGDSFPSVQTDVEIQKELNFLISFADQVGFSYQGSAGDLNGLILPLSYYSTADYWGKYVGELPGNDLHVVDVFNTDDYTLKPAKDSPGGDLQVERLNVYNGTDIYDAACWQIALGLCGKAGIKHASNLDLFDIAENQDRLLLAGFDGNATKEEPGANRAITRKDGTFSYNRKSITNPIQAYTFRMVTRNWLSTDPFLNTSYMKYVTAEGLPSNSEYEPGKVSWMDWKPITGENAWAYFIGPLQTAHLKQQSQGGKFIPLSSQAIQNALEVLLALRSMQSEIGGIYYACEGSLGNQGEEAVNPYEVSVENNASALAGLMIFRQILQDELDFDTDLSSEQKEQVKTALSEVKGTLFGGKTPQGKETKGLIAFFKNHAWDSKTGIFYQGGEANHPRLNTLWKPTAEPKAVDVSTWGLAVLGQPLVDSWYGFGSSYLVWQNVKGWGGFFGPDGALWGVGYSNQDGNGVSGNYEKGIMSAEWTAGAINLLRCLIAQYKVATTSSLYSTAEQTQASEYVESLKKDHDSMFKNVLSLRNDLYPLSVAYSGVRPDNYAGLIPIPDDKLAFIYGSKRYMIPFGWFANPLPSTTSTSWLIMLHYNFNPFKIGGDYLPYDFEATKN